MKPALKWQSTLVVDSIERVFHSISWLLPDVSRVHNGKTWNTKRNVEYLS